MAEVRRNGCQLWQEQLLSKNDDGSPVYPGVVNSASPCPRCAVAGQPDVFVFSLSRSLARSGRPGWLRDLTCEGVEANPGPCPENIGSASANRPCGCNLTLAYLIKPKSEGGMGLAGGDNCPCSHPVWKHNDSTSSTTATGGLLMLGLP
jgi:hypothetical protein